MNTWETLVASALVGTSRQEPSIDLTHPALSDYSVQIQSQSATQQILSAAGLLAAYQAVSNSPSPVTSPLLAPMAAVDLPCCSQLTTRHLSTIWNERPAIWPEILKLLAQARQTVTPDFLPLLLDLGRRGKELRSLILPILGSRGQWLASQNPDWKYAMGTKIAVINPAELQEIWAIATRSERLAALTQWRQIQPAEARQAIAASWKQDKADDRKAWLEVLQTGLSLDDEEFLEVALFDRSAPVCHQAANLLRQLPSQYRQRLTQLASKCLTIKEKDDKYKIEITLPQFGDKEWQAAGVNDKAIANNIQGLTMPEWQLLQVISAADLDIWMGEIDRLIDAAMLLPNNRAIVLGWTMAAGDRQQLDWIEALLTKAYLLLGNDSTQHLLQALSNDNRDFVTRFLTKILTADNFADNMMQTIQLIMNHDESWNAEISILVVQQFHKHIHNLYSYQQRDTSLLLGRYLDVSVLQDLQQMQSETEIEDFSYAPCIELLEFRRDMRSSFNTA
jgi:Family of unknown function (DUF5691)